MLQDHYLDSNTSEQIDIIKTRDEKGIVQCDLGYITSFDKDDYEKLYKFSQYINSARQQGNLVLKNELISYYEQFLSRKYQDKTVSYEWIPEPINVGFKPDRVVFAGLERIADLTTGQTSLTFQYYAIGSGTTSVLPSDQALEYEEWRVSMASTGFAESKGSSMVFAANFPTTLQSMDITEAGIFDRLTNPSTMLLRTVYEGSNIVPHVFNQTFIATSHFVYQLSV